MTDKTKKIETGCLALILPGEGPYQEFVWRTVLVLAPVTGPIAAKYESYWWIEIRDPPPDPTTGWMVPERRLLRILDDDLEDKLRAVNDEVLNKRDKADRKSEHERNSPYYRTTVPSNIHYKD